MLDLVGSDYSDGVDWVSRVGDTPLVATVPTSISYDSGDNAFRFGSRGETITVRFATNPIAFRQITYEVWVKLEESPTNNAWILSQSPDYGWSRAMTMNDGRLGGVSSTSGNVWNSELGQAPLNQWVHVVAVWDQDEDGSSIVYMDGVPGASQRTSIN